MKTTYIELPDLTDELSDINNDEYGFTKEGEIRIFEALGFNFQQKEEPSCYFVFKGKAYYLFTINWDSKEKRSIHITYYKELKVADIDNKLIEFRNFAEQSDKDLISKNEEIIDLKNRIEELKINSVPRDLFLQSISASNGKILK